MEERDLALFYEPISFDLLEAGSILEKANRWVGRATSLMDSSDRFRIHMLVGGPTDERLRTVFHKAQNILNKMPGDRAFVQESEAEAFAEGGLPRKCAPIRTSPSNPPAAD